MLLNLHVKNLALLKEADLDLERGLNIFTGETGAGKSLLLGSVNLALGARAQTDLIRHGADYALVELTFSLDHNAAKKALEEAGFQTDDGLVVISRKITGNKSIFRINGEGTTSAAIRSLAGLLLDIHGQHDHQSLLYHDRQLAILDEYGAEKIAPQKEEAAHAYQEYRKLKKQFEEFDLDEEERLREISLLEYEIREIEEGDPKEGEEAELEERFRLLDNAKLILQSLDRIHELTGYENGAADLIGKAVREISAIETFDRPLGEISQELAEADALLGEINRSASSYAADFSFSEEELAECEERLDTIRRLQAKYGKTPERIRAYAAGQKERLSFLKEYEERLAELEKETDRQEEKLRIACEALSRIRRSYAQILSGEIIRELQELNFEDVRFEISFSEKGSFSANGRDQVDYLISVNPGEPLRPLSKIASGGELSRIMLAIKTILSQNDPSETLIFDEIDSGISGRTAARVAEKLARIGEAHQVLCITHLAQIAAAADTHYGIHKTVDSGETVTHIMKLNEKESEEELARLLGGSTITETVRQNAREMKSMAKRRND